VRETNLNRNQNLTQNGLRSHFARWCERITGPTRRPRFTTASGIELPPLFLPAPGGEGDYLERLGFPGEPPFTRGIHPTMYRGRLWTMRQYAGYGSAEESNQRYRYLLEQGQTGLSVAFDLPTQMGYDSDNPVVEGEVGRVGVAIDSIEDMERLLDQLPLDRISTSMTINATAGILLGLYLLVGEGRGIAADRLSGTVQNDLLKEYIARGTYIYPPGPSLRLTTDLIAFCLEQVPNWNPISISGYHIREAGSTAVQEVAFTLANGIAYVESGIGRGLAIDDLGPRLSFFFNAHSDFVEEVAKFRAARRLWGRIMRERFGAKTAAAARLRFHAQTAGSTLTAQQPEVNGVRVAIQALAAVCGGAQSLHANAYDEALSLPSQEAARLALRTQQVIAEESGVANLVDPLGGAYAIEAITDTIESEASKLIATIDGMGGMMSAIESGWVQREIHRAAYRAQRELETGERRVVGVNCHVEGTAETARFSIDPAIEKDQRARLVALRKARSDQAVRQALDDVRRAADSDSNLMPPMIAALRARATLGEVSDALRAAFGVYREGAVV
jgi:methylmalonyl-CoA mutase N-terminal domain/subunit